MGRVVGIDLGTTNSAVAVMEGGEPTVIINAEGLRTTPSVVAVSASGELMVGTQARNQAVANPENTIYSVKHLMGQRYEDPQVQDLAEKLPFPIVRADNGAAWVEFDGEPVAPPEIAAMILARLKADAEAYLGEEVSGAVVTVPAYFDDGQRTATRDAGEIAGLTIERIINEPTAAALAFGHGRQMREIGGDIRTVAVYDLGGGTFDISIVEVSDDMIEVRATNGDTFLGGDIFDERIIDKVIDEFRLEHSVDLRENSSALQRLKEAAVNAKHELSTLQSTTLNLPFIAADISGPLNLLSAITREELEEAASDLIDRTLAACERAMEDAGMSVREIDTVLLVGGQTRMPLVRRRVEEFFGTEPRHSVNPDEAVALGAAIQAETLKGEAEPKLLLDVTPMTLSTRNHDGQAVSIIPRNTTIPTVISQTNWSTVSNYQTEVRVEVLQGEAEMADENKLLGYFMLSGIRRARAGQPRLEITFEIDADGILDASARDLDTGAESMITVNTGNDLGLAQLKEAKDRVQDFAEAEHERRGVN